MALIATHQFTRAQQIIEKNTHWSSEQLIGRIAFCAKLPDHLVKDDIADVVRYHIPEAEKRTVDFLVDYVVASKKHLACVDHGVRAARHVARREGRNHLTHRDVLLGFNNTVLPSDRNLAGVAEVTRAGCDRKEAAFQGVCSPIANAPAHPFPRPIPNGKTARPCQSRIGKIIDPSPRAYRRPDSFLSPKLIRTKSRLKRARNRCRNCFWNSVALDSKKFSGNLHFSSHAVKFRSSGNAALSKSDGIANVLTPWNGTEKR